MFDHQSHIQETLKNHDPERYLACLYLPEHIRHCAMTLYAFDAEISRIPSVVSEPMPGEIRIQWWRDLVKSGGNVGSGPLAEALLAATKEHKLPLDVLDNYLEARIFDLYQDPMPDVGTYEGYLGETVSSFLNMIALASGVERSSKLADACGHAGVAIGVSRHLSLCSNARARGQVFFPLPMLEACGLNREQWLKENVDGSHEAVIFAMISKARDHLSKAKIAIADLPSELKSIFLPIVFVDKVLDLIGKNPAECLVRPIVLSPLRRQWLAFRGIGKL